MTKYIKDIKDNTSRGVLQDIWKKLKQLEFSIGNGNGGGNTPNLQQVTDEGNTTNQDIEIVKLNASKKISVRTAGMQEIEAGMISNIGFFLRNMLGTTTLNIGNNTADRTLSLPDEDGTLATQEYVNLQKSYSEDEILTNIKWIDNKPVYRIVIPFVLNANGFVGIDLTGYNIETPISNNAILNTNTGNITEFNSDYRSSPSAQVHYFESRFYDDGGLFINIAHRVVTLSTGVQSTTQANRPGYLILEYTKTTD